MSDDWRRKSPLKSRGTRNTKKDGPGRKPPKLRIGIDGVDELPPEPYVPTPTIPRGDLNIV